jgi:hypothetical protein
MQLTTPPFWDIFNLLLITGTIGGKDILRVSFIFPRKKNFPIV